MSHIVKILHGKHLHEVEASLQALVDKHGCPEHLKIQDNGTVFVVLAIWNAPRVKVL